MYSTLNRISKSFREMSETNWLNEVNQNPKLRTHIYFNKETIKPIRVCKILYVKT